jgi:pimeloyl-ACP methyl ester carboxylesterase
MDWWPPAFCRLLADGGRYVLRYDHRDTGRSTTGAVGAPAYAGDALRRDLVGLLCALGYGRAHLVGVSMGGGIAQAVALQHAELVASLTLIATSAVGGVGVQVPPIPALQARFAEPPPDPKWGDRDQVVDWFVEGERAFAGPLGIDADDARAAAGSVFDRSHDIAAAGNHWLVVGDDAGGGDDGGPDLDVRDIDLPTLVVHGSHDPLFPLPHGRALAGRIPGARLLVVQGMGHQVPPRRTWPTVVPAVLALTQG